MVCREKLRNVIQKLLLWSRATSPSAPAREKCEPIQTTSKKGREEHSRGA